MPTTRWIAVALATFAFAGCGTVLGLDDFSDATGAGAGNTQTGQGAGGNSTGGGAPACLPGETIECLYGGPTGTKGVGVCTPGTQVCNDMGSGFEACVGQVTPAATEDCTNALDDDCNGAVNDECPCAPGTTEPCYDGPASTQDVGVCHAGTHLCDADGLGFGPCAGQQLPAAEDCTLAQDENCDGAVDEASAGCVCAPNDSTNCYSGPPGTENVGNCKGGTKTCNSQGTSYGACIGDVTPVGEVCAVAGDEDCDGVPCSETAWVHVWSSFTNEAVAVDAAGNSYVVGQAIASFQAGGVPIVVAGGLDLVLVKIDASGNVVWGKAFGDLGDQIAFGVSVRGNTLAVTGAVSSGSINFGGPNLGLGAFAAKLDTDGNHVWSKSCGGGVNTTAEKLGDVTIDPSGAVVFAFPAVGTIDCGSGSKVGVGQADIVVAKVDAAGTTAWTRRWGSGGGYNFATGARVDPGGNVYVAGRMMGTVDFGGGPLSGPVGSQSAFLVKLSSGGAWIWNQRLGTGSRAFGLDLDSLGQSVIAGSFLGTVACGNGPTLTSVGATWQDVFVCKLNSFGSHIWSKAFGDSAKQEARDVAVGGDDSVALTGTMEGSTDFGGGPLAAADQDVFLAKLSGSGVHVWSKRLGASGAETPQDVAVGSNNYGVVVGAFNGAQTDLGLGPVPGPGVFTFRFAP